MPPRYVLHGRSYGVAVCAGINGSTTLYDETGEGKSFFRPINEWILPAANVLTGLIFQPTGGALPGGEASGGTDAYVDLELMMADADGMPIRDVPPLGEFHWPNPARPTVLPAPIMHPVAIGTAVDTHLWQQAETVTVLADADRTAIVALVNGLNHALVAQDLAALLQLLDYRLQDEAKAREQDPAAVKSSAMNLAENFARFQQPPPLTVSLALFSMAAGGKAWHVERGWMKPAVFFANEEMELSIEVYASRIDGKWLISRG